jgi:hypothetical protein
MNKKPESKLTREYLSRRVGNQSQIAGIRPFTMNGGKSEGLKAFEIDTGCGLEAVLLEGKCLDIASLKYKGIGLNFLSKPGLVAPQYASQHGSEFQRNFQGGMLYTCGLSNVGSACTDMGSAYGIHGRIGCTSAEKTSISAGWQGDEYLMEISGEMREAALFGENLVLRRKITSQMGARHFRIQDTVENQGFEEQPLLLLYHFNFGYPMLCEGVRIVIPSAGATPRDAEAAKGLAEYGSFGAPIDGYKEQVFYHDAAADENGITFSALINDRLQMGVYIRYSIRQLPRLIEWKSLAPGDYALGIEPSTCLVEGRAKERERGTLQFIAPAEVKAFDLEIGILDGLAEIDEFEQQVKRIMLA